MRGVFIMDWTIEFHVTLVKILGEGKHIMINPKLSFRLAILFVSSCMSLSMGPYWIAPFSPTRCFGDIIIDYTDDDASHNFFNSNATAKAALEAAVADINAVIDFSSLGAITSANQTINGTSGFADVDLDFEATYTSPSSNSSATVTPFSFAAQEVRIFVGMRELANATLGVGGARSASLTTIAAFGGGADLAAAARLANDQANQVYGRGDGPVISNQAYNISNQSYSIDLGLTHGNLWFDIDTDNDGTADNATTLSDNWHFDHTTSVAAGKSDFYSVALHETLHAIGLGTSQSWMDLVSGNDWLGANVNTVNGGSGIGLIDNDGGHFDSSVSSTRINDGTMQSPVMTPSLTLGSRKYLTALDVAALNDIGFTVTAVPEPANLVVLIVIVGTVMVGRRQRSVSC